MPVGRIIPENDSMTKIIKTPGKSLLSLEDRLLESIKPLLNYRQSNRYPTGIGDDAAIRQSGSEKLILTADSMVENVHFSYEHMSCSEVGYKALAANLSDCAAMGAMPDSALVQIIFPERATDVQRRIRQIYRGFNGLCRSWNFPIVGGNLSSGPCWVINITLIGRISGRNKPLKRTGIRPGDFLFVSGYPGESGAGLDALNFFGRKKLPREFRPLQKRHIQPVPRIELGKRLGRSRHVHACIDISDGLSKEARILSHENHCAVEIDERLIPLSKSLIKLGRSLGKNPLDWCLHGGEDYELLFAASPAINSDSLCRNGEIRLTRIGRCIKGAPAVVLKKNDGNILPVRQKAWDHLNRGSARR